VSSGQYGLDLDHMHYLCWLAELEFHNIFNTKNTGLLQCGLVSTRMTRNTGDVRNYSRAPEKFRSARGNVHYPSP